MKKISMILAAFVLALGLTQCRKEVTPTTTTEENGFKITLDLGSNSRAQVDPAHPGTDGTHYWAPVSFEEGDIIYVGYRGNFVGTLSYDGTSRKFNGTLNATTINTVGIDEESKLYFYLLGGKGFTPTQDGNTFTVDISDQTNGYPVIAYDDAEEPFTVERTSYTAKLKNKASIMKFNVTTNSTAAICITGMNNEVTVNFNPEIEDERFEYGMNADDGGLIKMPAKNVSNETWAIVLPQPALAAGAFGSAYTEDTENESNCYLGSRPSIIEIGSNEYIVSGVETMTMTTPKYVNLDGLYGYTGKNGQVLYNTESGSMPGDLYISRNATVTLRNVTIHRGIDACNQEGDISTIVLEGVNHVDVENSYYPYSAVHTQIRTTLVIKGTGTLYATGSEYGAGIGAFYNSNGSGDCGNIRIEGGIIYATGGGTSSYTCAGIGGIYDPSRTCGDITITGGEVHATGASGAPGIGSGGICGNISISGGTVVATATGSGAAGIGTGKSGTCGDITITNNVKTVTAIKGTRAKCIGLGWTAGNPTCGTITIGGTEYTDGVGPNQTDNKTYIYEP